MQNMKSDIAAPAHIAIIMDGNGRWAQKRGLPRTAGHKAGAEATEHVIRAAGELGVKYLTLFGFSTENWGRPADEVSQLMGLLRYYLKSKTAELHKNKVKLTVIGDRSRLDSDILDLIESAEKLTVNNDAIHVQIALSYSGRWDLTQAAQNLAQQVKNGTLQPHEITQEHLNDSLSTAKLPDPDLLIRTSGEERISNFLLWQCAYAEFYFSPTYWPDFGNQDLVEAIRSYNTRNRRFGSQITRSKNA